LDTFDLAFGLAPQVIRFARSFTDRRTLCWLDWEDWMYVNADGSFIRLMDAGEFRGSFAGILTRYFARFAQGKLKFNLTGMDASEPASLTTWELETLLRDYRARTTFYVHSVERGAFIELMGEDLSYQLRQIFGEEA